MSKILVSYHKIAMQTSAHNSLVIKDLVYGAKAETFFSRPST